MAEMKARATREAYGDALKTLGGMYENLFVLDADLSGSTKTAVFAKEYPERFINCGIAEGNMMSVAAGIAAAGNIAFASSFAMFAAGRAFEQIRNSIGYPHLNVKVGASHAGLSVGEDGATHQCCEDMGIMRTIPGMVIINPSDYTEAYEATIAAAKYEGPVYIRYGRLAVPVINDPESYTFEWGKGTVLSEGTDVSIIATGLMVAEAIKAKDILAEMGISAEIVNIHTVKPIDKETVMATAKKTGVIVTTEEHNVIGGLGDAVLEAIAECPVPVVRHGVEDVFGKSGEAKEVLKKFGLTAEGIVEKVKYALTLKK